jgi:hypothetical protein
MLHEFVILLPHQQQCSSAQGYFAVLQQPLLQVVFHSWAYNLLLLLLLVPLPLPCVVLHVMTWL